MSSPGDLAQSHLVTMADEVRLATDVYLPAGPGPWPTVLIRHPYAPCEFMPPTAAYLNEAGYATVIQIVRGKNRSEGAWEPFVHDASDAHQTLDWIDDQVWSNGDVATFGDSYYGFTQWAAAASGHPTLRALAPRMTSSDVAGSWMYPGGAFNLGPIAYWAAITWADQELCEPDVDWGVRPLRDLISTWLPGRDVPVFHEWSRIGPDDPYWTRAIYGRDSSPAHGIGIPVLHRGAWWDPFLHGQLSDWTTASKTSVAPQYLTVDATDHYDCPWTGDGSPSVDVLADVDTFVRYLPQYLDETIEFFDVHLRDRRPTAYRPAVRYRIANGPWRDSPAWPPPDARELQLHLTPTGELVPRAQSDGASLAWTHDPSSPVPSVDPWHLALRPVDEHAVSERDDVLAFTTDAHAVPVDLVGPVSATLRVGSSARAMQVVAVLLDVFPDGRAFRIAEGVKQARVDDDAPVVVDLGPVGYRLRSGHRLRLCVSSSSFPRYLPYVGADHDPWNGGGWPTHAQRLRTGGSVLRLMTQEAGGHDD